MLKPVLVVLTLAQGGGTHLALTSPEGAEDCAARSEVVRQVLEGAGIRVIEARCAETEVGFTPYSHNAQGGAHIHPWRVTLPQTGAVIEPLGTAADCTPAPEAMPAVHCAMSAQSAAD